jgi:NAD(P)-dependent dehydrogenase (short-subunit alcohol dehydrogenase family)
MQGKTVVITGATSGIGQVAAEALARMGARIVQVARDAGRGEAAFARLEEIAPNVAHKVHYADLSRLAEMKRVGAEIAAAEHRVDVLINNAGAVFASRQVTEDGLERTFALNHMSYFVMTALLRERLLGAAPARVVNTASGRHRKGHLDFSDLQAEKGYEGFRAYANSKLCNVLFTRALARRLTGVTANCLHPGFVATRFGNQAGGWRTLAIRIAKLGALTPEQGAQTLVYLASSPEVAGQTGGYYGKSRLETPSADAQDANAAEKLWAESERIARIPFPPS